MKNILNELLNINENIYRTNNEHYQILIIHLTKQLMNELMNQEILIEQIYYKKNWKFYQQWRQNIIEFYRNFILNDKFYIYRDITMPLMKQIFQIVLAFDYHYQQTTINEKNMKIFHLCQFPYHFNEKNLLDIAKDLFEKRTFIQQHMSMDRFRQ